MNRPSYFSEVQKSELIHTRKVQRGEQGTPGQLKVFTKSAAPLSWTEGIPETPGEASVITRLKTWKTCGSLPVALDAQPRGASRSRGTERGDLHEIPSARTARLAGSSGSGSMRWKRDPERPSYYSFYYTSMKTALPGCSWRAVLPGSGGGI